MGLLDATGAAVPSSPDPHLRASNIRAPCPIDVVEYGARLPTLTRPIRLNAAVSGDYLPSAENNVALAVTTTARFSRRER